MKNLKILGLIVVHSLAGYAIIDLCTGAEQTKEVIKIINPSYESEHIPESDSSFNFYQGKDTNVILK